MPARLSHRGTDARRESVETTARARHPLTSCTVFHDAHLTPPLSPYRPAHFPSHAPTLLYWFGPGKPQTGHPAIPHSSLGCPKHRSVIGSFSPP